MKKLRYLVKLSGEVLKGPQSAGIDWDYADKFCERLAKIILTEKVELGLVIGGGNIFRGASGSITGYDRIFGDNIGMLATVMNGLALAERLKHYGVESILQSGLEIPAITGLFHQSEVEDIFSKKGCVIFCGGTGNPYFSTDTTAALRALQIKADCIFKATKVDGIYDKDPHKHEDAKKFKELTYDEIIAKRLKIMDLTAMQLMMENKIPLMVFNMDEPGTLENACAGEVVGTIVKG
ncbi:MAG: UMP kinase [Spirochaetes bacterium]|nr:UMP kinase [Spirochaetota bacterium]